MLHIASLIIAIAELVAVVACGYLATVTIIRLQQARGLEFNRLWPVRVGVVISSMFWVILLVLESPALFGNDGIVSIPSETLSPICAGLSVAAEGVAEPMTLLIPVFTFRFAARSAGQIIPENHNSKISNWSMLLMLPFLLIHAALMVLGIIAFTNSSISGFFLPFDAARVSCSLPLASTIVQAVFVVAVLILLNLNSHKYSKFIINKRLTARLRMTQTTLTVALPIAMLSRVAAAVAAGWVPQELVSGIFFHIYFFITSGVAIYLIWSLCYKPVTNVLESPMKKLDYSAPEAPQTSDSVVIDAIAEPIVEETVEEEEEEGETLELGDLSINIAPEAEKPHDASSISLSLSSLDMNSDDGGVADLDEADDVSSIGSASVGSNDDDSTIPPQNTGTVPFTPSDPRHRARHLPSDNVLPRETPFVHRMERALTKEQQ